VTAPAIDPRFTNRKYQPGLDLLRALSPSSSSVVIYHAGIMGFPLPGRGHGFGCIGVDLCAAALFFTVERPFLLLRYRISPR
jgi:peptidoglycan/LPS O-acetylase OafA/YrhL